jgi:hypothetical protein
MEDKPLKIRFLEQRKKEKFKRVPQLKTIAKLYS